MVDLRDKNSCYLIICPEQKSNSPLENNQICEKALSILYSKDYTTQKIYCYQNNVSEKSYLGISTTIDNDELRKDAIYLMDTFLNDHLIVKYRGDEHFTKIDCDGSEKLLEIAFYKEVPESHKNFILEGISFSFNEKKRYFYPRDRKDLKDGIRIEYYNNEKWVGKVVEDIEINYDKFYKLLLKYNKLRICVD